MRMELAFSLSSPGVAAVGAVRFVVSSDTFDPDLGFNRVDAPVAVRPVAADLSVLVVSPDATLVEGAFGGFVVTVGNAGPDAAANVEFGALSMVGSAVTNAMLGAISSADEGVVCSGAFCRMVSLAAGRAVSMRLELAFSLSSPGVAAVGAVRFVVSSDTFDPDLGFNRVDAPVAVRPVAADLSVLVVSPD